ncbi:MULTISPECIES: hypothetical protein [Streptomyces]|uniref:Uncharacterized protein n=1 Tax=Streptomyces glycanivorans TaxID=3033808 RepID=A0ABY9JPD3_9ACTN|nr:MULTISPECIES: hypothetical protein [unclassified Streptomyces]WSQ82006.1 hypothetical protein OG725_35155 [Streptomyces sp. NBC_01213]TXS09907.1 hypothetical protein EAO68_29320 [Streptomyces sp. wa22]WLQ68649.1 hypothetical protein P8A20_36145 [Streptomyces sp. Alt3]WSQ89333.1 hypothetical protein OG722_35550 [Streptomyces sp. NBC_01212]WSR04659.1 hypothetical protein OG265_00950 [Streptomyces sp. NBC_01208]
MKLSYDEVVQMLRDRPEQTRTYEVESGVIERLPSDTPACLRPMNEDEVRELANYLQVSPSALHGPFQVVDHTCSSCARTTTFLDFVKTAVDAQRHSRDTLRSVLTDAEASWVTVRGRDGGRPVICANCGNTLLGALKCGGGEYSEYSSGTYAYA